MTTFYRRRRPTRPPEDWLDKAAKADQIILYAMLAALFVSLIILLVENLRGIA